ncbi:hypothetical protein CEXT_153531 [Caerostris extrusa]|uniref:Uncharacterized protein n=1 Tax=Caerostris extrusa TaxID=172846 RepID=A0AAV4T7K5_CAEEX|nr:hypothetical protein CEXT_153531 [Caerostris extrusa]
MAPSVGEPDYQTCKQVGFTQLYESVVRRVVNTEDTLQRLQERYEALLSTQKQWLLERDKLLKLIPAETARALPGASRSPTKRRAHSPEREDSSKRQRIEPPTPSPASAPAPTPAAAAPAPTPAAAAPTPTPAAPTPACCTNSYSCCTNSYSCCANSYSCCTNSYSCCQLLLLLHQLLLLLPGHQISSSCSTQASQLKPEPPRRPGRPVSVLFLQN